MTVFLDSDEGLTGESVLLAVNDKRTRVLYEMVRSFETLAVGRVPEFSDAFANEAGADARHIGASGPTSIAIGAIQSAMLDLLAKAAGLPVHHYIGARQERVPAYYSGGLWNHISLDALQATASRIAAHGYRAMKLRVGVGDLASQVARVRAVREAVGDGVRLMIDAGGRFGVEDAIRLGKACEEFRLEWFEEPVAPHDHAAEARVAAALDTPIASGENILSAEEFRAVIDTRCVDVLMPDLQRVGGPGPFLGIARMAAEAGLPVSSHLAPEMSLALLATIPNASFLEVMPWPSPLYAEPIEIVDGFALAPQRSGWGYALDQDALRRYAVT